MMPREADYRLVKDYEHALRDWFAALAMQGLLSDGDSIAMLKKAAVEDGIDLTEHLSLSAYEIADAMLATRQSPPAQAGGTTPESK